MDAISTEDRTTSIDRTAQTIDGTAQTANPSIDGASASEDAPIDREQQIFFNNKEIKKITDYIAGFPQPLVIDKQHLASKEAFEKFIPTNDFKESKQQFLDSLKDFKRLVPDHLESETAKAEFSNNMDAFIDKFTSPHRPVFDTDYLHSFRTTRHLLNNINKFFSEVKHKQITEATIVAPEKLQATIYKNIIDNDLGSCIGGFCTRIENLYVGIEADISGVNGLVKQAKDSLIMNVVRLSKDGFILTGDLYDSDLMDIHHINALWNILAVNVNAKFLNISTCIDSVTDNFKLTSDDQQNFINEITATVSSANITRKLTNTEYDYVVVLINYYKMNGILTDIIAEDDIPSGFLGDIEKFITNFNAKYQLDKFQKEDHLQFADILTYIEGKDSNSYKIENLYNKLYLKITKAVLVNVEQRTLIEIPYQNLHIETKGNLYFYVVDRNDKTQQSNLHLQHITPCIFNKLPVSTYRPLVEQALIQTNVASEIIKFFNNSDIRVFLKDEKILMISLNNILSNKITKDTALKKELVAKILEEKNLFSPQYQFVFSEYYWVIHNELLPGLVKEIPAAFRDFAAQITCKQAALLGSNLFNLIVSNNLYINIVHIHKLFKKLMVQADSPIISIFVDSNLVYGFLEREYKAKEQHLGYRHRRTILMSLARHQHSLEALKQHVRELQDFGLSRLDEYFQRVDSHNKTALIYAIESRNIAFLDIIIELTKKDILRKIIDEKSILTAIDKGFSDIVHKLLTMCEPKYTLSETILINPLRYAVMNDRVSCIREIISYMGQHEVDFLEDTIVSLLISATEYGYIDCIKALLKNLSNDRKIGIIQKYSPGSDKYFCEQILSITIEKGYDNFLEEFWLILQEIKYDDFNPSTNRIMYKIVNSSLKQAQEIKQIKCARVLIKDYKAELISRDETGKTNFMKLVIEGNIQGVVDLSPFCDLFDVNAACNNGYTALMYAVSEGNIDILKAFKDHYKTINWYKEDNKNYFVLSLACYHSEMESIEYLATIFNDETDETDETEITTNQQIIVQAFVMSKLDSNGSCDKLIACYGIEIIQKCIGICLKEAVEDNNISVIKELNILSGYIYEQDLQKAYDIALKNNYFEAIRLLGANHDMTNLVNEDGQPTLMYYVLKSDINAINQLYSQGNIDINQKSTVIPRNSALMLAIEHKLLDSVEALVELRKLNPFMTNDNGRCALTLAVKKDNIDVIKLIMPLYDKNTEQGKAIIKQALLLSFQNKSNCTNVLTKYYADEGLLFSMLKDSIAIKPLANQEIDIETFKILVNAYFSSNGSPNKENRQYLFEHSLQSKSFDKLLVLIQFFEMADYISAEGYTAIMYAAIHSDTETLAKLYNCEPLAKSINNKSGMHEGYTALMFAVFYKKIKNIEQLAQLDIIDSCIFNEQGESALFMASKNNDYGTLSALCSLYTRDNDEQNTEIEKAYIQAIINGNDKCKNFFVEHYNFKEQEATYKAFELCNIRTIELIKTMYDELTKNIGFDINAQDENNETVLMKLAKQRPDLASAVIKAHQEHIKTLKAEDKEYKKHIIKLNIKNSNGKDLTDQILAILDGESIEDADICDAYHQLINDISNYRSTVSSL